MEFKTKEEFENRLNRSYVDFSPERAFTTYTRPERHYIYPKYDIFDKQISDTDTVNTFIHDTLHRFVCEAIISQAEEKPVDLLSDEEKLGVYIGAGIPMKYENGKLITLYDVGISMIDGKYQVFYKIPKLNVTYC